MAAGKQIIVDVRTDEEFHEGHLDGALHIDIMRPDFLQRIGELAKDASYKLYCRSGNRSGRAAEVMLSMGFQDVENVGSVGEASEDLGIAIVE